LIEETMMTEAANWKFHDGRDARGGWAPGDYLCICGKCQCRFMGAKRAFHCADCAYAEDEAKPAPPSPPDVNLIARAFEVALPAHAGPLSLSHNEHRLHFNTVAQYLAVERAKKASVAFVSDGDEQEAQANNELWILYWSSEKGKGRRVAGATLTAIFGWLQHHGLAFGN
jgi:hypothetical protein